MDNIFILPFVLLIIIKTLRETDSITIGIELCKIPQISEHCPKNVPSRLTWTETWFNLPGYASALIPKAGQANECITSADETIILTCVNSGIITLLSTSSILKAPSSKSYSGTRYESNSINSSSAFKKSGYW